MGKYKATRGGVGGVGGGWLGGGGWWWWWGQIRTFPISDILRFHKIIFPKMNLEFSVNYVEQLGGFKVKNGVRDISTNHKIEDIWYSERKLTE